MTENVFQKTVAREVSLTGRALLSGEETTARIEPVPENQGIVFVRSDLDGNPKIAASVRALRRDEVGFRCTALGSGTALVYPVEHLLSAFYGLGITNAVVVLEGAELPFFDGSARPIAEILLSAGLLTQKTPRRIFEVTEKIQVSSGDRGFFLSPSDRLSIEYHLLDEHPQIGRQHFLFDFNPEGFLREIAPARTFCTEEEGLEFLQRGGRGGGFDNCLVFGKNGVLKNSLRFPEEPARHKILDLIGDLSLLGCDLKARIVATGSGHSLNAQLLEKLDERNGS